MGKKTVQCSLRLSARIAEIIKNEADRTKRSFNNQLSFWLENGGIPAAMLDISREDLHDESHN